MIEYKHIIKVFYKDVDQMGIVYYSRYFEYFEQARTEMFNSLGLKIKSMEDDGVKLPVISSHCDYSRGAQLEDVLFIKTSIKNIPKPKLKIKYEVLSKDSVINFATGYTVHAFVNHDGKPIRPPQKFIVKILDKFSQT